MFECLAEELIAFLLATIPAICAVFQSFSVVPRRRDNITSLVQAALTTAESKNPEHISPAHYLAARGGTERIKNDFRSLYGGSFLASALIVTILYFTAFWIALALLAQSSTHCILPGKEVVDCLGGAENLRKTIYAALGSYVFNLGVMVRRAFLSDITEHVFWSAINRLVLSVSFAIVLSRSEHFDMPYLFFGIAFIPRVLVSAIKGGVSAAAEKITKSGDQDKTEELPLDLVQGIDIWKEQRLEEEGIESIQNLATADVLTLAVKTHYPLRTLIDWIDQAILINRLPGNLRKIRDAGFPISAIEFGWMSPENSGNDALAQVVAGVTGFAPIVAASMMNSFYEDAYVNALWSLWQTDPEHRDSAPLP
jgi:hypothetical protein